MTLLGLSKAINLKTHWQSLRGFSTTDKILITSLAITIEDAEAEIRNYIFLTGAAPQVSLPV